MQQYDKYRDNDGKPNHTLIHETGTIYTEYNVSRDILVGSNLNRQGDKTTPQPFYYFYTSDRSPVGETSRVRTNSSGYPYTERASGTFNGNSVLPRGTVDYDETLQTCLEKIYDQLRGESAQVLVDIAESAATLRLLKSTLNLKKFTADFVRTFVLTERPKGWGKPKPRHGSVFATTTGQKQLDYLTQKWLEYRYGWTPLVHSIYDAANLLYKQESERIVVVKGRSGRKKLSNGPITGAGTREDPFRQIITKWSYRTEAELRFKLPGGGSTITDWTTLNPARLAWELFPFSFVADWLFNISNVLDQFENYWLFRNQFIDGWQSNSQAQDIFRTTSGITIRVIPWWFGDRQIPNAVGTETVRLLDHGIVRSHERKLLTSLPYSNQVRINVKLGAKRQLDAAALFHQLVNKRTLRF